MDTVRRHAFNQTTDGNLATCRVPAVCPKGWPQVPRGPVSIDEGLEEDLGSRPGSPHRDSPPLCNLTQLLSLSDEPAFTEPGFTDKALTEKAFTEKALAEKTELVRSRELVDSAETLGGGRHLLPVEGNRSTGDFREGRRASDGIMGTRGGGALPRRAGGLMQLHGDPLPPRPLGPLPAARFSPPAPEVCVRAAVPSVVVPLTLWSQSKPMVQQVQRLQHRRSAFQRPALAAAPSGGSLGELPCRRQPGPLEGRAANPSSHLYATAPGSWTRRGDWDLLPRGDSEQMDTL